MPSKKTGNCSKCGTPVWIHSKDSLQSPICLSCRRANPTKPKSTKTRGEQLLIAQAAANTPRDKTCDACGLDFKGVKRQKRCPDCQQDVYRARWRDNWYRRQGVMALGEVVTCLALVRIHGSVCHLCGGHIDLRLLHPDPLCFSFDHVIPLACDGVHSLENMRPSHLKCNLSKGART
jgi:endogenous inhibitor of DNA gyrase (YacG/DUF329 family)